LSGEAVEQEVDAVIGVEQREADSLQEKVDFYRRCADVVER